MDDDSKQAWMKVGLHFAAAGDKLRNHAKAAGEAAKRPGDDGPDQAAVVDALNTLGKAVNQAVSSVSGAVKDPEVRDNLTEALNSMGEAMNVTFGDVGDKVSDTVADVGARVSDKVKDTFGRKPPTS
jgi:gas vesicle protein